MFAGRAPELTRVALSAAGRSAAGRTGHPVDAVLAVIACALVAALLAAVFWLGLRRGRRAGTGPEVARPVGPDQGGEGRTDELVRGLTAEVRRWRADSAYWKETALRLQRALDHRDGDGGDDAGAGPGG